jgi:hypothetical protein
VFHEFHLSSADHRKGKANSGNNLDKAEALRINLYSCPNYSFRTYTVKSKKRPTCFHSFVSKKEVWWEVKKSFRERMRPIRRPDISLIRQYRTDYNNRPRGLKKTESSQVFFLLKILSGNDSCCTTFLQWLITNNIIPRFDKVCECTVASVFV